MVMQPMIWWLAAFDGLQVPQMVGLSVGVKVIVNVRVIVRVAVGLIVWVSVSLGSGVQVLCAAVAVGAGVAVLVPDDVLHPDQNAIEARKAIAPEIGQTARDPDLMVFVNVYRQLDLRKDFAKRWRPVRARAPAYF